MEDLRAALACVFGFCSGLNLMGIMAGLLLVLSIVEKAYRIYTMRYDKLEFVEKQKVKSIKKHKRNKVDVKKRKSRK